MASPPEPPPPPDTAGFSDVRRVGYLRKPKSMHKRFFVLRSSSPAGPARLEYYESEKKWRHKAAAPKRCIRLESCLNINKRADAKHKHLLALYTREECFSLAADTPQEQEGWYRSLLEELKAGGRGLGAPSPEPDVYGPTTSALAFREVWQVILKPKGLGQSRNLTGVYRLCLGQRTLSLVKLHAEVAALVLQLMNIRRCGHSEGFFFMELGRSAATGPGELWMQVDDAVVAQSMHETILEAMKAMSDEFRPRSKSQSAKLCSNPISVPVRRPQHPGGSGHAPPSQVGMGRRTRTESQTSPGQTKPGFGPFRVRASSDGEGSVPSSRPASVDGSPVSPGRAHSSASCCQRLHRGGSRLHPPLSHSRSIPAAACCRCSPSATSPVSLSSSSTSGHGSTSDGLCPRRSSASVSGSPSDGGFISSDEYGSSPCDFRSSFRSATPESLGHTPPAGGEELDYICMGRPGSGRCPPSHCTPTRSKEDAEKIFRKRTHSAGTSPPPSASQYRLPCQVCSEDYTEMMPPYRRSAFLPHHGYPEERPHDDGYMPMSPGVAPQPDKSGDYMPMSPKSVSAPQQILQPRRLQTDTNGYMMMSPSDSCSPDGYGKIWTNGTHPKLSLESGPGGDYMNMSPASGSTTSTPPDGYMPPEDTPAPSYYSLPRSFKHLHRQSDEGPAHRPLRAEDDSSSTSSDSLGGQAESKVQTSRLARPTRLSLDKASTLPRAREPPASKSPGEYVSIDPSSTSSLCSPSYIESRVIPQRETLSEYMNMDLGSRACKASDHLTPRDYMTMQPGIATSDYTEVPPTSSAQSISNYEQITAESRTDVNINYVEMPSNSKVKSINYGRIAADSSTKNNSNYVELPPAARLQSIRNYGDESKTESNCNYVEVPLASNVKSVRKCNVISVESRNDSCYVEDSPASSVQSIGNYGEISAKSRTQDNSNYVEIHPTSRAQNSSSCGGGAAAPRIQTEVLAASRINGANKYGVSSVQSRLLQNNSINEASPASRIQSLSNYAEVSESMMQNNSSYAEIAPVHRRQNTTNCAETSESRAKKQSNSAFVGRPPASRIQKVTPIAPAVHNNNDYADIPASSYAEVSRNHSNCCSEGHLSRVNRILTYSEGASAARTRSSYAEMALFPKPLPPQDLSGPVPTAMLPGQGTGLSAFTRVSLSPGHSNARVIRADPQGRRRHSSETFSSTPTAARGAAPLPFTDDGKRHSSASFENVSLRGETNHDPPRDTPLNLNYIDLDLGEDMHGCLPGLPGHPSAASSSEDLSLYARISFPKQEDLRSTKAKEE